MLVTPMEGVKARLQVQYAAGGKGAGVGGVIYKGPRTHDARLCVHPAYSETRGCTLLFDAC